MKRNCIFAAVVLIPVLLSLNVWQSFRYSSLKREVARLESAQKDLIEKNKRSITGISILESPERIEMLARTRLKLGRPASDRFIFVQPLKKEKETDG